MWTELGCTSGTVLLLLLLVFESLLSVNNLDAADTPRAEQAAGKRRFQHRDPCGVGPRAKVTLMFLQCFYKRLALRPRRWMLLLLWSWRYFIYVLELLLLFFYNFSPRRIFVDRDSVIFAPATCNDGGLTTCCHIFFPLMKRGFWQKKTTQKPFCLFIGANIWKINK